MRGLLVSIAAGVIVYLLVKPRATPAGASLANGQSGYFDAQGNWIITGVFDGWGNWTAVTQLANGNRPTPAGMTGADQAQGFSLSFGL